MTLIFASDIALKIGQRLVPGEPSADGFEYIGLRADDSERYAQAVLIVRESSREEWKQHGGRGNGTERYFYEIVTD